MKENKWSKEICANEALKYNTITEFIVNNLNVYRVIYKNRWRDEMCSHMIINRWSKKKCNEIALKYNNRGDFRKYDYAAYNKSAKYHWLDEICSHMSKTGSLIKRCIYVYEFSDNFAYVGLTYNLKTRDKSRKLQYNDPVTKHIRETSLIPLLKQISEYIDIDSAKLLEKEYILTYSNLGWHMLNTTKGGEIGCIKINWSKEYCQKEAFNFTTRTKFKEKKYSIYHFAKNNSWLDDICSHMVKINTSRNEETCRNIALKYKTKTDFNKNDKATYVWAERHKILTDICSHMINKRIKYEN